MSERKRFSIAFKRQETLEQNNGNVSKTAKEFKLSRQHIIRWCNQQDALLHGITPVQSIGSVIFNISWPIWHFTCIKMTCESIFVYFHSSKRGVCFYWSMCFYWDIYTLVIYTQADIVEEPQQWVGFTILKVTQSYFVTFQ